MTPVIDDNTFSGADSGLSVPLRRTTEGPYRLAIANLAHDDPPAPYRPGGVPRGPDFNANVFSLLTAGGMPEIPVKCSIAGFDPATVPILWRLQSLHVLGRHSKVNKDAHGNSHYSSLVVPLADEWRGESRLAAFSLFPREKAAEHVGGAHAILTVAARPPGASGWLQDFVHIRIIGANPTEKEVRAYVAELAAARDPRLEPMLDAIFAWEAHYHQFSDEKQTKTHYKTVLFDWPDDPAHFPVAAFDFGVGLSQFTHPNKLTASIAWDWRDNMKAGANIFLAALRRRYKKGMTWKEWAWWGWRDYNNSDSYADDRKASDDGASVSGEKIPIGFDIKSFTAALPLVTAPKLPAWPVTGLDEVVAESVSMTDDVARRGIDAIAEAVTKRVSDNETLTWMWPTFERQITSFDTRGEPQLFPGLSSEVVTDLVALGRKRLDSTLRMAFMVALSRLESAKSSTDAVITESAAGVVAEATLFGPDLASEWAELSAFVQKNIQSGFSGYKSLRDRLFAKFGAPDKPSVAIPRINAYYQQLAAAKFPRSAFKTPVHPDLKAKLDKTTALLASVGASAKLDPIKDVGGFAIRPNVNSPSELSNHSFGWAIDIDPALNPNIKIAADLGLLIAQITGVDVFGAESVALRTPALYADLLPAAAVLSQASADFVNAFKSEADLKASLGPALTRASKLTLSSADVDRAFAMAKAQPADKTGLKNLLSILGAKPAAADAGVKLCVGAFDLMWRAKGVTKPEISGTDKTIARFGFFNLAPEVVAALVAEDGGALRWLGSAKGTKDFMHAEIFPADSPKLF